MKKRHALGIDIGNVIIDYRQTNPSDDAFFDTAYSTIPATEGVFQAIEQLSKLFDGNVFIVSKATESIQPRVQKWLTDNKFYEKTGVAPSSVYFVRERSRKDEVCRELSITHFIDDRLEVLGHLVESVPHLYLFMPEQDEINQFKDLLARVQIVDSWLQAVEKMRATLLI